MNGAGDEDLVWLWTEIKKIWPLLPAVVSPADHRP